MEALHTQKRKHSQSLGGLSLHILKDSCRAHINTTLIRTSTSMYEQI